MALLTSTMCISVGFCSWLVSGGDGGSIGNNVLVGGSRDAEADYNIVSDGNQSYIDMRFTKQFNKSNFLNAATTNLSNTKNVEYLNATLNWQNLNNSYNDDVCEYFFLTDTDNPLGDNAPHIYNHETGDTLGFDKQQTIDRTNNQFKSSIVYGNNFQKFETTCTPDWTNFEPVYDTNYEKTYADGGSSAASYGGEWITAATNFTGNSFPWFRADLRCLKKNDKYYFFILYVFHYTKAHPYSQGRVCRYRSSYAFNTYSSQSIDDLSYFTYSETNGNYKSGDLLTTNYGLYNNDNSKYVTTYFRVCYSYKRTSSSTAATNMFTIYPCTPYGDNGVTYSSNGYVTENTSSVVSMTNPSTYAALSRTVYREVDYSQPIVCNAWPGNITASDIKWSYAYSYFVKHVDAVVSRTGTNAISTPLNCVFDHFELVYANAYSYTGSAKFYFVNTSTNETVIKTVNESISARGRNYLYILMNRIKDNTLTFDYYIRLRPKNETVKANMANYLKAYKFTLDFEIVSTEIANYARTS